MLTAAVRELHTAHPGQFQTDVRTSAPDLWAHNPYLTPLNETESGVRGLAMHYPAIHHSNERPYHFIHGYVQYLEEQLKVRIPVTRFHGDIHLSAEEKRLPPPGTELGVPETFWILIAGGKQDFTAKWWNPESYQKVVDHFAGRLTFVRCGESGHWHPPLSGVVDLVGKTSTREFVRLMYHAQGVVCPVTFPMHLAAAVETKTGPRGSRPCVVIAGGREPAHWEAYPNHQFISTNGALSCCQRGGCWKSRCQLVGDGDEKDRVGVCEQPVQIRPELRIPRCLEMISAEEVIRRMELYFEGGVLANGQPASEPPLAGNHSRSAPAQRPSKPGKQKISVSFHHGLGDCAYFAHLIPLYVRRGYEVEVECTPDKRILFEAAGAKTIAANAKQAHAWGYPAGETYQGHGRWHQGSKIGHNLSESPLPNIGSKAELWQELCESRIDATPFLAKETVERVDRWLARLPRPIVLLHTKGNTGQDRKSLPDDTVAQFYRAFLDQCDGSLVLLDWDNRVPRLASYRIRHLEDLGSCDTAALLALQQQADLMVGVDSGPLHASRFSRIPTIGIWMPGHYPATYTLPREEQLNVVLSRPTQAWNKWKRIPWNIIEHPGCAFDGMRLADLCQKMLSGPRYLTSDKIASDVQLQQFVREWCRGERGNSLAGYCDRNRSLDVLLRELSRRTTSPTILETGTIRAEEDWSGAGFFTYLAGSYVHRRGGRLISVDLTANNCRFAETWTSVFNDSVQINQADSVSFLAKFTDPIDALYLDSLDTTEPGHAEHALREIQAAYPRLHDQSLVVFDDTPWQGGAWLGKGATAVPWLIQQGWKVLYGGYQVVLSR